MAKRPRAQNSLPKPSQQPFGPQVHSQRITQVSQSFEGPIPPPAILQQYNAIVPDAAERILRMAEQENQHRQQQEDTALQANIAAQNRQLQLAEDQNRAVFRSDLFGQIMGFLVSAGCVAGSIYLASIGQPWVAGLLAGLPLAGIIRAFRDPSKK